MSDIINPTNLNFMLPDNFKFIVKRLPNVSFNVQSVDIPSISLPAVETPNPFVSLPYPGDHITYGDLSITFKLDERMDAWLSLHNWMRGLGFPESFEEYDTLARSTDALYSDIHINVTTNMKNSELEFVFIDAIPVHLSGWRFDTTTDQVPYIAIDARFRYTLYNINRIT